ncbi:MAG: pilus assembly protein PilC [Candidatus Rokubacteria bacterium RIFCSPLOWO2_12_FULL_69_21]|nr:MAG: pilus assembly protein PilC [candidate division NC10 bacterium RIFCSPLOWO2_02_FULL_66_22]OGL20773.1 MAG: pilus assembly protein PilC [Candidatus Rokubacteria bacterium RIFCSPLOWO2_12_FULL_69_21]
MPVFVYTGRTRGGQTITGEMDAGNREAVVAKLRSQQITATAVRPKPRDITIPGFGGGVGEKDIVVFTRQFATMIDAGLPLVQCLEILASQQENKVFKKALTEIRQSVEGGLTFAAALKQHPKVFTSLYANMVEAGEAGGILDTILNRLAQYMEKAMSLKKKVKSAMIYPSTIVSVAMVVVIFLLIFVIPTFKSMFEGFGATLPLPTQIVLEMSRIVRQNFLVGIGAIVGGIVALKWWYGTPGGNWTIDALLLKAPVFGILIRKVSVAKFTRTLGTLISSGVAILDGLEITARTAGNKVVEAAIMKTRASISEGKTIAEPLKDSGVFPPMVVQMIAVGEQTGALDDMLGKIADFYDEEVDTAVGNLTSLLEPMLMVFLGVIIGGVVIAMYLPIFKLVSVVGK